MLLSMCRELVFCGFLDAFVYAVFYALGNVLFNLNLNCEIGLFLICLEKIVGLGRNKESFTQSTLSLSKERKNRDC